jgi:putative transposon-encoded protein
MQLNLFGQTEENMDSLNEETDLKEIFRKQEYAGKSPKPKFRVLGEEMIEKEVKPSGNSGRIYLPLDWVGKTVKIIRID